MKSMKSSNDSGAGCWNFITALWLLGLTIAFVAAVVIASNDEPEPMLYTRWQGDLLIIAPPRDGEWVVTHLNDVAKQTVARLPEPVWVVESGGISISVTNLANLRWELPARAFEDVFNLTNAPAPTTNSEIRALYYKSERSRFFPE